MKRGKFLWGLSRQVLVSSSTGVSKVKLAKLIYLTHKWLIKNSLAHSSDLAYIRMPLGPVPNNFESIRKDSMVGVHEENVGLSYNRLMFSLKPKYVDQIKEGEAKDIIKRFNKYPTSFLVDYTHKEPSWKNHANGDVYTISKEDLKRTFSIGTRKRTPSLEIDKQRLQGHLVKGMIEEIVDASTSLEYPEED